MDMSTKLYQTLEDRSNNDFVELNGPFLCDNKRAWLGRGYYYWETFIEYAHWWGRVAYINNQKDYIVCLSEVVLGDLILYDLMQSETLLEFEEMRMALTHAYPKRNISVAVVLEHLRAHNKHFNYKAIRAVVSDATNYDQGIISRHVPFVPYNRAYLNTCPQIQVCFLEKTPIGSNNFKVIYPLEYSEDFTI